MKQSKNTILEGAIFPALMKFSIPILCSLILQTLYGTVDLWMVSQFSTTADISAVSTGSQTIMIASGFVTGLSMGITVLLGQSVGEQDDRQGANLIGTGTWIFLGIGVLLTGGLILAAPWLAEILHAPQQAFDLTVQYIQICGAGTIFVVAFNVLNGIFCGLGDSRTPLIFVAIACVVNVVGDAVLIAGLNLGTAGAAIATIAAQAVSVICCLCVIRKRLPFAVGWKNFRFQTPLALGILRLGAPVAFLRMCSEISYLLVLGFVNALGVEVSSGVGIAEKLVLFIMLIPMAYMSAISAFVAQNIGAQQPQRAKRSLWIGMATSVAIGGVMAYITFFHGDTLSALFVDDAAVIAISAEFLKATAIECFILSLAYCYDGYFNGVEKTTFVMVQGVIASLLVRVPYAYFASTRPDPSIFQIGFSSAVAAIFMLLLCSLRYGWDSWRERHPH